MHIKCLVILTCSFQMAAILGLFFDLLSCPCRRSHRLDIACTYVSLLYKRNDANVSFFLKFMSIFLKFINSLPGSPLGLEKWESIFQSMKSQGILFRLEKSGNFTQNTGKVLKMIKLINCKKKRLFIGCMAKNNVWPHSSLHTCPNLYTFKCHFYQQSITPG